MEIPINFQRKLVPQVLGTLEITVLVPDFSMPALEHMPFLEHIPIL